MCIHNDLLLENLQYVMVQPGCTQTSLHSYLDSLESCNYAGSKLGLYTVKQAMAKTLV